MKHTPVDSSNLSIVGYDVDEMLLEITFTSGAVYVYEGVDEITYRGLMNADSKGKYFNAHIKNSFPYRRV